MSSADVADFVVDYGELLYEEISEIVNTRSPIDSIISQAYKRLIIFVSMCLLTIL